MLVRRLPLVLAAVCVFGLSFILFLSGWILQQQSLQALNEALQLSDPPGPESSSAAGRTVLGNIVRQGTEYVSNLKKSKAPVANSIPKPDEESFPDERKTAYAVLANEREDVCHALIMFRKLREQFGVQSDLVLVLPFEWAESIESEAGNGTLTTEETETRRLVRLAMRERVRLEIGKKILPDQFRHENTLSPLNLLHLTTYKRVMMLNSRSILRISPRKIMGALSTIPFGIAYPSLPEHPEQPNPHFLVLTPSIPTLERLSKLPPTDATPLTAISSVLSKSTLTLPTYPHYLPTFALKNERTLESYVSDAEEIGTVRIIQSTILLPLLDAEGKGLNPWVVPKNGNSGEDRNIKALKTEFVESRRDVCGWDWEFEK